MKFEAAWCLLISPVFLAHAAHTAHVPSSTASATNASALAGCVQQHHQQQRSAARWLFVRGLHHGGTTLAAALLALHPDVSALKLGKYEDEASVLCSCAGPWCMHD
jgi:hypothetical protein